MEDLKRLTINLPLFSFDHGSFKSPSSASRSPRSFEDGIVGLGIVAAMDQFNDNNKSRQLSGKSEKTSAKLVVSPKSSQVLKETITGGSDSKYRSMSNLERNGSSIELSEHYTCVIFHAGDQSAKKREYFDDGGHSSTIAISSGRALSVSSPSVFQVAEFLNSCFLCGKRLDGLDIFMYRGEKAFCSAECRNKQMEMDDQKENWGSEAMKSLDYSVSPCSGQLQFFAQVVAV